MTENLTPVELVVFITLAVIAAAAVMPHMPRWAVYVIMAGMGLYWLLGILRDGASLENIAKTVMSGGLAALIWWRDLRGTRGSSRE
jgi:hypothetical protein